MGRPRTKPQRTSANAIAFAELCLLLCTCVCCQEDMMEATGVGRSALARWLGYLSSRRLILKVPAPDGSNRHAATRWYTWNPEMKGLSK